MPGGIRIFTSVLQAVVNIIDHSMSPQQAVEAPRLWTQGAEVQLERTFDDWPSSGGAGGGGGLRAQLEAKGHMLSRPVATVGGGMSCVMFSDRHDVEEEEQGEGGGVGVMMTGACCWRADGTPIGVSGGVAKPGARFRL